MLEKKNFILKWDLDPSSQDGYLHTRSFPLSLGEEAEFNEIKEKRIPIAIVLKDLQGNAIVAVSREKYPGELNSIPKGCLNEFFLNQAIQQHDFLKNFDKEFEQDEWHLTHPFDLPGDDEDVQGMD